ncbi:MAG: histidine phosphatase family protein [Croceibacterium sp.]
MKRLGLLRHAKSDQDDVSLRDFDRGLNARGRRGAALMGRHIREHGEAWDVVVASPAERVKLTLEASGLELPVRFDPRTYLADAATLLDLLQDLAGDPGSVLLAAHNPGLQDLVFKLVLPGADSALFDQVAQKYPTATYAVIELDIARWADLAPGCGRLVHFARPRDLDPALGPDN